jgi:hypothetical protein
MTLRTLVVADDRYEEAAFLTNGYARRSSISLTARSASRKAAPV